MPELDCRACGACCVAEYNTGHYAHLTEKDAERLHGAGRLYELAEITNRSLPLLAYDEEFWAMKTEERTQDHWKLILCKAFRGKVGERCWCAIYDLRPEVCRDFEPGSEDCHWSRAEAEGLLS
jgi:Fe-S-cluster containining protein